MSVIWIWIYFPEFCNKHIMWNHLHVNAIGPIDDKTTFPDSKVHGANMEPTWALLAPDGPHVDPINFAIRFG